MNDDFCIGIADGDPVEESITFRDGEVLLLTATRLRPFPGGQRLPWHGNVCAWGSSAGYARPKRIERREMAVATHGHSPHGHAA
jgi:hypothetical protein